MTSPQVVQGFVLPAPTEEPRQVPGVFVHQPPPPPPPDDNGDPWALPPGWATARSPEDGRIYYWEPATGRTSWKHPLADQGGRTGANLCRTTAQQPNHQQSPPAPVGQTPSPSSNSTEENQSEKDKILEWLGFPASKSKPEQQQPSSSSQTTLLDTPANAQRRPDSHQCMAVLALLLCCPLGLMAVLHSRGVDRSWKKRLYGDSVNHSRQAKNFAVLGVVLGIVILLWWTHRRGLWNFRELGDFRFD